MVGIITFCYIYIIHSPITIRTIRCQNSSGIVVMVMMSYCGTYMLYSVYIFSKAFDFRKTSPPMVFCIVNLTSILRRMRHLCINSLLEKIYHYHEIQQIYAKITHLMWIEENPKCRFLVESLLPIVFSK